MAQGQSAGANAAYQQQLENQAAANASSNAMTANAITGLTKAAVDTDWSSLSRTSGGDVTVPEYQKTVSSMNDMNNDGLPDYMEYDRRNQ